jgi:GTPase
MIGCEESGKSTLLGVLITGKKDNGKGSARLSVLQHRHEFLKFEGSTSSISKQVLGFDSIGNVTNFSIFGAKTLPEII